MYKEFKNRFLKKNVIKPKRKDVKLELVKSIVQNENMSVICVSDDIAHAIYTYQKRLSDDVKNVKFVSTNAIRLLDGYRPDVIVYVSPCIKSERDLMNELFHMIRINKTTIEIRLNG